MLGVIAACWHLLRCAYKRTQHLSTLLRKGPCKRTQQVTTLLRVVGGFGQQCYVRLHGPKSLTGFKLYVTSAKKCQHCCGSMQTDTTCLLGPKMLRVVGQQCCVRLHGPESLTAFKLYATSAKKCQHYCGSMQTDATCLFGSKMLRVQLLANNVASVCMGLTQCSTSIRLA